MDERRPDDAPESPPPSPIEGQPADAAIEAPAAAVDSPPSPEQALRAQGGRLGRQLAAERDQRRAAEARAAAVEQELAQHRAALQNISQRMSQDDLAREEYAIQQLSPEDRAEARARRAERIAYQAAYTAQQQQYATGGTGQSQPRQSAPPTITDEQAREQAEQLLAQYNAHYGLDDDEALRFEEIPEEVFRSGRTPFVAAAVTLAKQRLSQRATGDTMPRRPKSEIETLKAEIAELKKQVGNETRDNGAGRSLSARPVAGKGGGVTAADIRKANTDAVLNRQSPKQRLEQLNQFREDARAALPRR